MKQFYCCMIEYQSWTVQEESVTYKLSSLQGIVGFIVFVRA